MEPILTLSTADHVRAVAEHFFRIADLLHQRLNAGPHDQPKDHSSTDLYSLLIEEYGLRTRASILRNDAIARTVTNSTIEQEELLCILSQAGDVISQIKNITELKSIVNSVNTLCVGINPGKGPVVDFLAKQLALDVKKCKMHHYQQLF